MQSVFKKIFIIFLFFYIRGAEQEVEGKTWNKTTEIRAFCIVF